MVNCLFGLLVWNLDDILEVTRVKKDPGISDQETEPQCIKGWIPQAIFTPPPPRPDQLDGGGDHTPKQ